MSVPTHTRFMRRGFAAALLCPVIAAGCDISGPSSSAEVILEPIAVTWLSTPESIDPVTHPPEDPGGDVLIDSLLYKAEALVEDTALGAGPMSLTLQAQLRNPFDDPVTIQIPRCPARLRAYATIDRVDPPIWSPSPSDLGIGCAGGIFEVTVPPGDAITGGATRVGPSILSRELPDGRYYFTLEFQRVDKDPILLPAGSVDVRLQQPGLEFDVTLEDTGDMVLVQVQVTNRNDVPMRLLWGGCSLSRLGLYHDAARSNLAMELFVGCPDPSLNATVGPGETIHPDEFIRGFNHSEALGLPPGTYFLAVRIEINDHDYLIPAGDVLLR